MMELAEGAVEYRKWWQHEAGLAGVDCVLLGRQPFQHHRHDHRNILPSFLVSSEPLDE